MKKGSILLVIVIILGCISVTSCNSDVENNLEDFEIRLNEATNSFEVYKYIGASEEVKIPSKYNGEIITEIRSSAFDECSQVTKIIIPKSITNIYDNTFNDTALYKDATNWENGVLYIDNCLIDAKNISGTWNIREGTRVISGRWYENKWGKDITELNLPDSIISIGDNAFSGIDITELILPSKLKRISMNAFSRCDKLENIKFPGDLEIIGNYAFSGCSSLKAIKLPKKLTTIGLYSFSDCQKLVEVHIEKNVKSIETGAFTQCNALSSITFNGTKSDWSAIIKGSYIFGDNDMTVKCSDGEIIYSPDGTITEKQ